MTRVTREGGEGEFESWRDLALAYPLAKLSLADLSDDEAGRILSEMEDVLEYSLARGTGGAGRNYALPGRDNPAQIFAAINAPRLRDRIDPMVVYARGIVSDALGYSVDDICEVFVRREAGGVLCSDSGEVTAYEAVKGGGLKWPPLSREQCAAQYLVAIEDVRRAKARGDFEAAIQAADRRGEYRARLEHIDSQAESGRQKNGRDPVKLAQADEFKALVIRRWLELKDSPPNPKLGWGNRRNINNTAKEICKELREHPRIAGYSNPVDSVRKIIKAFEAKIGK